MSNAPSSTIDTASAVSRDQTSRAQWVWLIVLGALFVLWHRTLIERMIRIATDSFEGLNQDWGHILAIPAISIFFVYQVAEELKRQRFRVNWFGLPLMVMGVGGYALGIYPIRNDMVQGLSMVMTLFGM
ncbi:MAG: hypothetical protein MI741_18900, partial [Rhodospirillales bacterium]|nr:hypothetical protein [Rhodospirillales bacterium]